MPLAQHFLAYHNDLEHAWRALSVCLNLLEGVMRNSKRSGLSKICGLCMVVLLSCVSVAHAADAEVVLEPSAAEDPPLEWAADVDMPTEPIEWVADVDMTTEAAPVLEALPIEESDSYLEEEAYRLLSEAAYLYTSEPLDPCLSSEDQFIQAGKKVLQDLRPFVIQGTAALSKQARDALVAASANRIRDAIDTVNDAMLGSKPDDAATALKDLAKKLTDLVDADFKAGATARQKKALRDLAPLLEKIAANITKAAKADDLVSNECPSQSTYIWQLEYRTEALVDWNSAY